MATLSDEDRSRLEELKANGDPNPGLLEIINKLLK
jgi:hypothetical protein